MNLEGDSKLRVCASYLRQERNRIAMRSCRVLILEHILPTTEALIYLLHEAEADVHTIVAKPYSIDQKSLKRLQDKGYRVLCESYEALETTDILDTVIGEAIAQSEQDGRKILFIDVGGYFARPLMKLPDNKRKYIIGVIEDTTFGHNRYLELIGSLNVPVISVARSRLKEIEAHFVGRDAVLATDRILREQGVSITGKSAVVIGYGMIGKNVARSLKAADLRVSVYDIRDHRNLKAFMTGFDVNKKVELLKTADIVFAATGWSAYGDSKDREPALSIDEILERLRDRAILVSVGSKNNEFDIKSLQELAVNSTPIGQHIVKYDLPTGNIVYVIKDGTAVNFALPSIRCVTLKGVAF